MLEGTLEGFTLPDILQLLALTKKTGCLRLSHLDARGRVYFNDGQVYYAVSSAGRLALGRRLVGANLVTTEQLQRALETQREARRDGRGLRLGRILVEDGIIDEGTLEGFVREQLHDAVFDLMRWGDGAFVFDLESADARLDGPIELSMSVESLIEEGQRRLEEWESVAHRIPGRQSVVAISPVPAEAGADITLKPDEWRLLALIDGTRTVQDLIDISGQGEFRTGKVLSSMISANLLEVLDAGAEGPSSVSSLLAQHELLLELEELEAIEDVDDAQTPPADVADIEELGTVEESLRAEVVTPGFGEQPVAGDQGRAPVGARRGETSGPEPRLTTDPSIDEDLVRRLIDGVKGL